ncbi:GGDEF domain-containing protein [Acinetobacter sp.]|uniref:GGDEF domain-containing protein n=1 Tax=Acinetobacter sp. TaxID=472 RepID=UPI00388EBA66
MLVADFQQYPLAKWQDLIQILPIAAVLLAPDAKILLANQAYADFFTKDADAIVGMHLKDLDIDCYHSFCNDLRILNAGQKILPFEHKFAGREHRLNFQAYYNTDQQLHAVLLCAVDVSDLTARQHLLAQYNQHLQQKLDFDELTGLASRHAFQRKLNQQNALVVALLDLDDFKMLNDDYGHVFADRVLVEFGKHLKHLSAQYHWPTIYRVGGEEFVMLFEQHTLSGACAIVNQVRQAVLALNGAFAVPEATISVSCGVAAVRHPLTVVQALDHADRAMYQAKAQGKNAVYYYQRQQFYPYV